jgi:hypothetical protein
MAGILALTRWTVTGWARPAYHASGRPIRYL